MQRRRLLKVGLASGALLTLAGGVAWWTATEPGRERGRFQPATRSLFLGIGSAVLAGVLPETPSTREPALLAWLDRLETTVAGMPAAVQRELDEMVTILLSAPGRFALTGLRSSWKEATPTQIQVALQGLRSSTWSVRQQIFHALRDLSNAAYFAAPESWAVLGYPGPLKV